MLGGSALDTSAATTRMRIEAARRARADTGERRPSRWRFWLKPVGRSSLLLENFDNVFDVDKCPASFTKVKERVCHFARNPQVAAFHEFVFDAAGQAEAEGAEGVALQLIPEDQSL